MEEFLTGNTVSYRCNILLNVDELFHFDLCTYESDYGLLDQ